MTTTSPMRRGNSSAGFSSMEAVYHGQVRAGPFMLTLCQFQGPVSIRPPQSPQLRRFTFLTTRARDGNGSELVSLHMGYFETLMEAQSLLAAVRRRFPHAIATRTSAVCPHPSPSEDALSASEPAIEPPPERRFAPLADESLTDTQVMRVLETRGVATDQNEAKETRGAQIGILRPEDTSVRRALKQAVVDGAPVFFAVQLDWSTQPIDPSRVPPLSIFKTHVLYAMESRRGGRCRYFLRLGFFADAASAKEAAFSVRSKFASAVVVPVTEQEFTCAHEASAEGLGFAQVCLPIYEGPEGNGKVSTAEEPAPLLARPQRKVRNTETLEQTLETLAAREKWNDPDALNDTGVRHLSFEVLERKSGGS